MFLESFPSLLSVLYTHCSSYPICFCCLVPGVFSQTRFERMVAIAATTMRPMTISTILYNRRCHAYELSPSCPPFSFLLWWGGRHPETTVIHVQQLTLPAHCSPATGGRGTRVRRTWAPSLPSFLLWFTLLWFKKDYLLWFPVPLGGFGQLRAAKLLSRALCLFLFGTSLEQLMAALSSTAAHSTGWWAQVLVTLVALTDLARTWPSHCQPYRCGLFIPFLIRLLTREPGPGPNFWALMHLSERKADAVFQVIKTDGVPYKVFEPGRRKIKADCSFLPSSLPLFPLFFFFTTTSLPISLPFLISSILLPAPAFHLVSWSPFFFFHYNNCLKFKLMEIFQDIHHICIQIKKKKVELLYLFIFTFAVSG